MLNDPLDLFYGESRPFWPLGERISIFVFCDWVHDQRQRSRGWTLSRRDETCERQTKQKLCSCFQYALKSLYGILCACLPKSGIADDDINRFFWEDVVDSFS